ncbi:MAG TPA: YebC/PmpR family DNA-binding transcriptional regulator, partial [Ktedonobacteraceae bacterium]|nr:YebC/PmpR family DNA-binding transcriptional regulator [Ktedonobacteraceae bacterium]
RLRMAVQRARDANMPMDNIERTIKRATGGGEGMQLEEITYEGYGPGGTAMLVQTLTENRNRTVAEVRNAFNRNAGNMGENGSVDWLFENKGVIEVELQGHDPDELSLEAIDMGADDVEPVGPDDETLIIYTDPSDVDKVRQALEGQKYNVVKAESTLIPKSRITLTEEKVAYQVMRLVDKLEDLDDVQNVYTNADIPEEFASSYEG